MKIVISQPMYLPWPGLFDQISKADLFVHYDDVQLPQGRSFSTRVQLKNGQNISWLSVPIVYSSRGLINEAVIDNSKHWQEEHLNKIKAAFSRAPYFDDVLVILQDVYKKSHVLLADLNIAFIESISMYLNFKVKFERASKLSLKTQSTQRLIDICLAYRATEYITGHGAKNYLEHENFEKEGILVNYMNYKILPYAQLGVFTPFVTCLDLIAHTGKQAVNHLQSSTISWEVFLKNE